MVMRGAWPRQQALADRFVPTCISAQHFGNAKIVSAAAGWSDHNEFHMWSQSSAVTEFGALYTWGRGQGVGPGEPVVRRSLVPMLVELGARVGRCNHHLLQLHALAFAMGTHTRLGSADNTTASADTTCCAYASMPGDLVRRVVEACVSWPEGRLGN